MLHTSLYNILGNSNMIFLEAVLDAAVAWLAASWKGEGLEMEAQKYSDGTTESKMTEDKAIHINYEALVALVIAYVLLLLNHQVTLIGYPFHRIFIDVLAFAIALVNCQSLLSLPFGKKNEMISPTLSCDLEDLVDVGTFESELANLLNIINLIFNTYKNI
ncbi:hypothetical protein ACJX0J_032209 [Zea mays]